MRLSPFVCQETPAENHACELPARTTPLNPVRPRSNLLP